MQIVSKEVKTESIEAFRSAIRKSENALESMSHKGSNTTLIKKRLHALQIGLAVFESYWDQRPSDYNREEIAEARNVLIGLLPSLQKMLEKAKAGSPQKTLIERRIKAFEMAVAAIEETLNQ
ncbi:hypothetical protein I7V34_20855 [Bacillus sp. V3]|nr:hypothetical protein I7V34_20855 [Bacillus sp. V3]